MNTNDLLQEIEQKAVFSFARSGGPGGQNVNKVNTKVFISVIIDTLTSLSPEEKYLILSRLSSRIDSNGALTISVEDERSQYRNREIAIKRIGNCIISASHRDKKRIPTKPGKAAKLKNLLAKKKHSLAKSLRTSPKYDE